MLKSKHSNRAAALVAGALVAMTVAGPAAAADSATSTDELRNTVINILDSLVQKGILTADQAKALVADAQVKAEASAAARAQQEQDEKNAVRVTTVPPLVRFQIESEMKQDVADAVIKQAKRDRWGVPGALPDWIGNLRLYGDVRARVEDDAYDPSNLQNIYVNIAATNKAGGVGKLSATQGFLNVSENNFKLVGRGRLGLRDQLTDTLALDMRITSGSLTNPVSTNQTLGNYGNRWSVGMDKAALLWTPKTEYGTFGMDLRAGRFDNPFVTNGEMIWDTDLNFEGLSTSFSWNSPGREGVIATRPAFLTLGAFPIQQVDLSPKDKWLLGAQLGTELRLGDQSLFRFAAAYYDYLNVTGIRNTVLGGDQYDWTAPASLQKGNTLYDIRYDNDPTTDLYALASKYHLLSGLLQLDLQVWGDNHLTVGGEYVKNIGWSAAEASANVGYQVTARTQGFEFGLGFGRNTLAGFGQWHASVAYRSVQRDAVLDAFNDSDFHLGGTDARGYIYSAEFGLTKSSYARLRYLSANEIDGAPLGIDVAQLDFVGQF
jgi:polyhydroxyalkanoate synthesis regulator phasin